jgi:hypothetical protein
VFVFVFVGIQRGKLFNVMSIKQFVLDLDMEPVYTGLFWCCCPHISTKHSLVWLPPDQKRGRCIYCGKVYTFISVHGKEEGK